MDNRSRLVKWVIAGTLGMAVAGGSPQIFQATPLTEGNHEVRVEILDSKEDETEKALESITDKIAETEQEAESLIDDLKKTSEELIEIQKKIELVSGQMDQQESRLQSQARTVQSPSQLNNVLSSFLESDSSGDASGRFDVVHTLFSINQNLMSKQICEIESISANERLIYEKHEEQILLAAQLENNKIELEQKKAEQEMIMADIAVERAEISEEREELAAQQHESEGSLETIQTTRVESLKSNTIPDSAEPQSEVGLSSSSASSRSSDLETGTIVNVAHSLTASPYAFSGTSPAGFDCSGFTQFAYRLSGKSIPKTAASQFSASSQLSQSDAEPGDLIFFNQSGSLDHVGIYIGGGRFIGSQTSTGVAVASFTSGYWSNYVAGFGRP